VPIATAKFVVNLISASRLQATRGTRMPARVDILGGSLSLGFLVAELCSRYCTEMRPDARAILTNCKKIFNRLGAVAQH
jgi:hypothetical protein